MEMSVMLFVGLGLLVAVSPVFYAIGIYNNLVALKNQVSQIRSSVDVMLKKRCDLIPNLVESVMKYVEHESETLARVTELRNMSDTAGLSTEQKMKVATEANQLMKNLVNVAVEAYPDLKADAQFLNLQKTLTETEEQLSASRRAYNGSVTVFNNAIEMFPSNLIAAQMNLRQAEWFEGAEADRATPDLGKLMRR